MPTKIIDTHTTAESQKLLQEWEEIHQTYNNPYSLYSSPEWFDAMQSIDLTHYRLGVSLSESGVLQSVVPLELRDKEVELSIRRKKLFTRTFSCAHVMGGEPVGDVSAEVYDSIFQKILSNESKVEAIYFKCLEETSSFFTKLQSLKKYVYFVERESSKFIYIKLNKTFDEYLLNFKKKERYNLKRQCRIALEESDDNLQLKRITETSQIDHFVESSKYILNNSWKSNTDEINHIFSEKNIKIYKMLAEKKFFRSYLLLDNNEPWAFALGFQHQGIFHYSNIAHNNKFAKLSPGAVLFYQMMEDLFEYDKPNILNFGIGDSQYKRRFGTDSFISSDVILFKKNVKNICSVQLLKFIFVVKKMVLKILNSSEKKS